MTKFNITIDNARNAKRMKTILDSIKFVVEVEELKDDGFELSPELLAELDRRDKEMLDNPNFGLTLNQFKKQAKARYGF